AMRPDDLRFKPVPGDFSPPLRGGEAARSKKPRRRGGDQPQTKSCGNWITTPSAPQRMLRDNLLMSRPPLLGEALLSKISRARSGSEAFPPLSRGGMPSRGGGGGGL